MSASYVTKMLLAFRSGDRCAFPECQRKLTIDSPDGSDATITGQAAHIAGEREGAARFDKSMTDEQRNSQANLIYLCADHHSQIDKQASHFPISMLLEFKAKHEERIRKATEAAFAEVGFPELQRATEWVNHHTANADFSDLTIIPPEEKIRRNGLSNKTRATITMGLSVARTVESFIQEEAMHNPDYPNRLKAGFLEEYFRLRKEGYIEDELFDLMCEFSQRGLNVQHQKTAGLAVLVYMFEKCDIFEK